MCKSVQIVQKCTNCVWCAKCTKRVVSTADQKPWIVERNNRDIYFICTTTRWRMMFRPPCAPSFDHNRPHFIWSWFPPFFFPPHSFDHNHQDTILLLRLHPLFLSSCRTVNMVMMIILDNFMRTKLMEIDDNIIDNVRLLLTLGPVPLLHSSLFFWSWWCLQWWLIW